MKNFIIIVLVALAAFLTYRAVSNNTPSEPTDQDMSEEVATGTMSTSDLLMSETWVWQETVMNNDEVTTPNEAEAFTLSFAEERVSGTTDCNSFSGGYTLDGTSISFEPFAMTRMACAESQEQDFVDDVTEANQVYFDDNGHLVLLFPYDSGSVIFAPAVTEEE